METNIVSNTKQEKSSQGSIPSSSRKQDLTWDYVSEAVDSKGKKVTACNFCGKQYVGISSMKQHLAGLNQSKTACKEVSPEVRDSIIKSMEENKEKTKEKIVVDLEMNDYEVKDGQSSQQSCTSQSRKRKRETRPGKENMAESAKQHIDRIRRTKFSIGGEENPLTEDLHQAVKNLSAELYAKDVHFLMELIQNAEDNEYPEGVDPSLEFVITSDDITATGAPATLLIFNNEKGFSDKNIESICSVGRSTKKGNRKNGYIGEKGIGFKSVFLITSQPYIFSNGYQIRFNESPCSHCGLGYIVPEWVDQHPSLLVDIQRIHGSGSPLPTTTIILPLKSDKVDPVKQQLSNVHPEVLLFLSKIKNLSIREHCQDPNLSTVNSIGIITETDLVKRKSIDAESYTIILSANETDSEKQCSYYMWRQKFPVKQENRVERRAEVQDWVITLAFPLAERLSRGHTSPGIYAFLPTEMVTNFPFIIQADFILSSSRETVVLDDKWNQGILNCLPLAFVNAFTTLVKKTDAPISTLLSMFRFLPVKQSSYAKLNVVRDSIRERICAEEIVPSVSHLKQRFFHKPCEVGRLIPAFWDILEKARRGLLQNISSHGVYVLDSSFDRKENDDVLNFLSLREVSNEWYSKCIQGCDLVTSVSETTYVEILVFIAKNWEARFKNTNMVKVPLIKYHVQKGGVSLLSSLEEFNPRTLCLVAEKNHSWLVDWNCEFGCMSDCVFLPHATRKALNACSADTAAEIRKWLSEKVTWIDVSVSLYAQCLLKNLKKDKRLVVAYAHFLHHSISKGFLSDDEAKKCCQGMPLVDNYGIVKTSTSGVIVPASAGKWVSLTGRQEGYLELWEEYMTSGVFAGGGVRSKQRELLGFLKEYAKAGDIPELAPPDAAVPSLSGALQKQNAFLLLEWMKSHKDSLPPKFLDSVRGGSWLRTKMNGSYDYRPPSQSFYNTSSWGSVLKNASVLVDVPLVDKSFYGKKIESYTEELKTAGVMFEFSEACAFVGSHLMSLAGTSSLSRENVFSILKFIRSLREKLLSPDDFITSIKGHSWLKTSCGDMSPEGAVLFSEEWKAASLISEIPFVDGDVYGEPEMSGFKEELKLLGVVVEFPNNHSLIVSHLKPEKLNYLAPDAMILLLECMRNLSSQPLVDSLRSSQCLKTKGGYKTPAECFISDPDQTCFLTVFDDVFPLIDEGFYGSRVSSYKKELEQIGVVVQVEEAVKAFVRTLKQKATSSSGLTRDNALSLLSCYRKLMGSDHKLSEELLESYKELQWLQTKLGDFRAPKECILFYSEWEPLRLVANLPFIDDSVKWYGKSIHSYKKELKSLGVTVELKQGMDHLFSSLSLADGSCITPSSALSLLKCVSFLIEDGRKLTQEFLNKVSVRWLKTHAGGYKSPEECLWFEKSWGLEPCDGPFIDEKYYGSKLKLFKKELIEIGVVDDQGKASQLLAEHVYSHSDSDAISRIYRFLSRSEWKQEKDSSSSGRIWIPSDEKWADVSSCVVRDKDKLFGSHLNVLENHYKSDDDDLLDFFSSAFDVRTAPSVRDYCALWKEWEETKDRLSNHECCAFWSFLVRYGIYGNILSESFSRLPVKTPDSSSDGGILLSSKSDVFIADDLLLKDLFIGSSVFVWYPTPSIPALSQTKLMEIYRTLGVKDISKCVETAEAKLTDRTKVKKQETSMIGPGLVRLVLGFLSDPSLKIEAEERSTIIGSLVSLNVLHTPETISTDYTLTLPSKGEKLVAKSKKVMRWEREEGVVYAEKMKKTWGKRKVLEYATCFAEVIAKGVMSGREDLIERLSELVKMAYLVEFDEEALEFLMKSKNLQVYEEDEKLITDAFSPKEKLTLVMQPEKLLYEHSTEIIKKTKNENDAKNVEFASKQQSLKRKCNQHTEQHFRLSKKLQVIHSSHRT
ncbi:ATP/DNA binding protein [Hirschfeldia incana]|nr:ATP/DNA binding protein [Hirschfeldia incana]